MVSVISFVAARVLAQAEIPPSVEPARAAVARLSQKLGRPVEIERSLGVIPVLVDASALAPKAVVQALAAALRASVVTDGKALRIERSAADKKALAAVRFEMIRSRAIEGMAAWDEILHRAESLGDIPTPVRTVSAEMARVRREIWEATLAQRPYEPPSNLIDERMVSPAGRLLHDLLARMGPNRLAQLQDGSQTFFSDRPNAVEQAMVPCADLISTYAATKKAVEVALGQPASTDAVAKVILRVQGYGAAIDLYNANGKRLDHGWMTYSMTVFSSVLARPADLEPRWVGRDIGSRRMASLFANSDVTLRPEELPESYLHPERVDPLNFDVRTALLEFRRSPKAPALVAVLSDNLLGTVEEFTQNERIDAAGFQWRILGERGFETVERDGVTILRPKDAMTAEGALANREILGTELRRIVNARDYGTRSRCLLHAALYPGCGEQGVEGKYVWALQRLFGSVINDYPTGALALAGTALLKKVVTANVATPPFDWLVRDGILKGWLKFEGGPGTSDLDLAPSSLLASLGGGRLQCSTAQTPVLMRHGVMNAEQLRKIRFFGEEPEALGRGAVVMHTSSTSAKVIERWKQQDFESLTRGHYVLGRRQTFGLEVGLRSGLQAKLGFNQQFMERPNLAFDELPGTMGAAILRGAQDGFDHPPTWTRYDNGVSVPTLPPVGP